MALTKVFRSPLQVRENQQLMRKMRQIESEKAQHPALITTLADALRGQAAQHGQRPRPEHAVLAAWTLCSAVLTTRYASVRHNAVTTAGAALRAIHVRHRSNDAPTLAPLVQQLLRAAEEDNTGPLVVRSGFATPKALRASLAWYRCGLFVVEDFGGTPPAVREALDTMLDADGCLQSPFGRADPIAHALPTYAELSFIGARRYETLLHSGDRAVLGAFARALVLDMPAADGSDAAALDPVSFSPVLRWMREVLVRARDDGDWQLRRRDGLKALLLAVDDGAQTELQCFMVECEERCRTLAQEWRPLTAFSADKARRLALVHALASDPEADVVQAPDARYAVTYVRALDDALLDRVASRQAPEQSETTASA